MEIFEFSNYRDYLRTRLGKQGARTGLKSQFAQAIQCQTAYVSQVLKDDAHLSPEQAHAANEFFAHTELESRYFMILVQEQRAGTPGYRKFLKGEREKLLRERNDIKNRVGPVEKLNPDQMARYYSSWIYAAIHVALSIPELQTPDRLCEFFRLEKQEAVDALAFLTQTGLVDQKDYNTWVIGKQHIHLEKDSPLIWNHHLNWRMKAMDVLQRQSKDNLHYSAVYTLSREDVQKIQNKLIEAIEEVLAIVRPSKEEEVWTLSLDFFR